MLGAPLSLLDDRSYIPVDSLGAFEGTRDQSIFVHAFLYPLGGHVRFDGDEYAHPTWHTLCIYLNSRQPFENAYKTRSMAF